MGLKWENPSEAVEALGKLVTGDGGKMGSMRGSPSKPKQENVSNRCTDCGGVLGADHRCQK